MKVCVFCGSSKGTNPVYETAGRDLALALSKSNCSLVYGGGNIGLMGVIADEMLRNSAYVIGVIPDFLVQREVVHRGLSELKIVKTMHERKQCMADLADAFIVFPGGMGTLDEMAEILTWKQLGLVAKPVGLLNINSYFDPLLEQLKRMVDEGFLKSDNLLSLKISNNPRQLITLLGGVPF